MFVVYALFFITIKDTLFVENEKLAPIWSSKNFKYVIV